MTGNNARRPLHGWSELPAQAFPLGFLAGHQFLRNKRQEWEEYRSEVTAFELRKNLPVL
nr:glutamine synthetase [Streptomyces sp. AC495_CC817]